MAKKTLKTAPKSLANKSEKAAENGHQEAPNTETALAVQKTYKLYIGGKFPRTESGRFFKVNGPDGKLVANMCRASRKDFRNAVVAARKAFGGWAGRTAYNRGQIIYRIAEMLEGRRAQFEAELVQLGSDPKSAAQEVQMAIDRLIYYAGWADKYQQIFSSVNPVASSHFNFSVQEPTGVVAVFAPEEPGLLGLVSSIIPAITGGNTVVVLASEKFPTCAITFGEVLQVSDVPGGVVNLLTGHQKELLSHFSTHMDVNAMIYCGNDPQISKTLQTSSADNLKRTVLYADIDWLSDAGASPYFILDTQETKTTWHPVGK